MNPHSQQTHETAGLAMNELPVGAVVEVETGHHTYRVKNLGEGRILINGHPQICPEPLPVELHGSIKDGCILKEWFIGPGMKLAFQHPNLGAIQTSRIRTVRELAA